MRRQEITPQFLRQMPLPRGGGDKNSRGSVLVIAGSVEVPGAAILASTAVLRSGAGKVQIATCSRNATPVGIAVPEALVIALPETQRGGIDPDAIGVLASKLEACDAVLIGPGLDDPEAIEVLTVSLLKQRTSPALVIDAAAIKGIRDDAELVRRYDGAIVLTPHAGEMAGLLQLKRAEVEADPENVATQAARDLKTVVAMKGTSTFIVDHKGGTALCTAGNPGLATAGSGDTLAGMIAGLLARGASPFAATCWGVYLHGKAGEVLARKIGGLGYLARELPDEIPRIMADLA